MPQEESRRAYGVRVVPHAFAANLRGLMGDMSPAELERISISRGFRVSASSIRAILRGERAQVVQGTIDALSVALDTSEEALLKGARQAATVADSGPSTGADTEPTTRSSPASEPVPGAAGLRWRRLGYRKRVGLAAAAVLSVTGTLAYRSCTRPEAESALVATPLQRAGAVTVSEQGVSVIDAATGLAVWGKDFAPAHVLAARFAPWAGGRRFVVVTFRDDSNVDAYLAVFDIATGSKAWPGQVYPAEGVAFFGRDLSAHTPMWCSAFDFADLRGDGEPELVTLWHEKSLYPACLRVWDSAGRVVATYFHTGYLDEVLPCDLDDDGRDELLVAGTNNVYSGGTVLLFDDTHITGASRDNLAFPSSPMPDSALVRVIFPPHPQTVMDLIPAVRLRAFSLSVNRDLDGRVYVMVWVGTPNAGFILKLDVQLQPFEAVIHDGFARRGREWRDAGLIGLDLTDATYRERWLDSHIRFVAGHAP